MQGREKPEIAEDNISHAYFFISNSHTMKKPILLVLLAFLCLNARSQEAEPNRRDYSPYGLDENHLSFQMRQLAPHGDATQITYFDLNFADGLIQDFMSNRLNFAVTNVSKFIKVGINETFTVTYTQMATMGGKPAHLYFKYLIFTNKQNHPIIKSLDISGYSLSVINFFVSYWPTVINFDPSKTKIAYSHLWQDKATIKCNQATGVWSISIENTTIHDLNEYYSELDKNIANGYKIQEEFKTKQQKIRDSLDNIANNERRMRDSLIIVAKAYNIPIYNSSPDLSWLKSEVKHKELQLNSGDNYNQSKDDGVFKSLENITPEPDKYITGNLIFRIDASGVIDSVVRDKGICTVTPNLLASIDKIIIGKHVVPYSINNHSYASYKRYNVKFIPQAMTKYEIAETGEIIDNHN